MIGEIRGGWYCCRCGQKLFRVRADGVLINHVAYCKRCKAEHVITIKGGAGEAAFQQLVTAESKGDTVAEV